MRDLERFAAVVARCVAAARPSALYQPLQVDELRFQIAPYRVVRGDLGLASIEEYELLLLKLLAGVDGLAAVRPLEVGELCRVELDALVADLSVLDRIGGAQILVNWPVAVGGKCGESGMDARLEEVADDAPAPVAQVEPEAELRSVEDGDGVVAADEPERGPELEAIDSGMEMETADDGEAAMEKVEGLAVPRPESIGVTSESAALDPRRDPTPSRCGNCGCRIPRGRPVRFCPACGANVVPLRCTRCNGELDPDWRHCVLCGQAVINDTWFV